ncbi:YhdP family protein [Pararhizobium gei]|uniref:YhdP family protein n=1 Tax=Pararhizobium gei TaxID=1395951 RepID=UPI0023DC2C78|nr:DUF3971 domain-containing protein [Rhizobium gei]
MNEIRGEKISFRKQDIVALHSLPSAQAHEPFIVHAPQRRGTVRILAMAAASVTGLLLLVAAALVVVIEGGFLDGPLNARAQAALNAAIGEGYHAEVASTVLRLTSNGGLALRAQNVSLVENQSAKRIVTTDSVSIELNPLALLRGRIAVSKLEAQGATLDPSLLPQGKPLDLTTIRISDVEGGLESFFTRMDALSAVIDRSNTRAVRIADLKLVFAGPRQRPVPVIVDAVDFQRNTDGSMQIDGELSIAGEPTELHLSAGRKDGRIGDLSGIISGLPLAPFLHRAVTASETAFGITSNAELRVDATRAAGQGQTPALALKVHSGAGVFDAGGLTSELKPSELNVSYDFSRERVEILPSVMRVGHSVFPFTGAISDLDPAEGPQAQGYSLDFLLQSATAAPLDVLEAPLMFDAKAQGRFLSGSRQLEFNELTVSSALGTAAGSLSMMFGETSPQISFALVSNTLQTAAVKQLWPWWIGKNARRWVVANIFGGTVTNGQIEVSLPMGRISSTVGPIDLNGDELNVGFDIDDARINVTGDIPPLRDAAGRFTLKGEHLDVEVKRGTAYFPSGRSASVTGGNFVIPNTYAKPLIAEMKIDVAGTADSIAELVSYRPIDALKRTPFKPEDFSGAMTAQVGARFGLVKDQNPPPPEWQAQMVLDGVTLNKPVSGRNISDIRGTLRIDPAQAVMEAKADIDGIPMDLALTEPVGAAGEVKRSRSLSATVSGDDLAKLAPGIGGIVSGPVGLDIEMDDSDRQTVTVDLGDASMSLPWVGWSKGPGIAAKATFTAAAADGVVTVDDMVLSGDNFGAKGKMVIDKSGLSAGQFSSVRLSKGDDYTVGIKRQKGGFSVDVRGSAADLRPVIDRLRSGSSGKSGADPLRISLSADLNQGSGFHDETLSNIKLNYTARGSRIAALDLSAVTDSGQAVVAKLAGSGADDVLEITSGDAGSLARFANVYGNMRGGLLNIKLRDRGGSSWRGSVDIRKFSLVNEERLQSMVSTPAGNDGRSLSQAVKRDINVSTANFSRGFANVMLDGGAIAIDSGVVRGTDIGATFQGTVRDGNGNMDMTGTFMPAYGLNRLFGELPLIGALLGNGRDRGLLGITFKLTGPFTKPSLTINPLSIIAPGVFRSIFEFQ